MLVIARPHQCLRFAFWYIFISNIATCMCIEITWLLAKRFVPENSPSHFNVMLKFPALKVEDYFLISVTTNVLFSNGEKQWFLEILEAGLHVHFPSRKWNTFMLKKELSVLLWRYLATWRIKLWLVLPDTLIRDRSIAFLVGGSTLEDEQMNY